MNANHTSAKLSTHLFLYGVKAGIVQRALLDVQVLRVRDDVWIGHNAVIAPGVPVLGRGSIIGSGAIVAQDVPRKEIVMQRNCARSKILKEQNYYNRCFHFILQFLPSAPCSMILTLASLTIPLHPVFGNDTNHKILSGFNIQNNSSLSGKSVASFECPSVPVPVKDMSGFLSRYDPKDPTQSKVDETRVAALADREGKLRAFASRLSHLADLYLTSDPKDFRVSRCIWTYLADWADAGALSENIDRNDRVSHRVAVMVLAWQVATYAAVALKVSDHSDATIVEKREKTLIWMRKLLQQAMNEDNNINPIMRLNANHLYWVGVTAAFMSALTQDQELKAFALRALRHGLDDVGETGALRAEMRRGGRALMYQEFATLPIAILVRFADANGVALTAAEQQALLRLVQFSAQATTDPGAVQALVGVPQQSATDKSALPWIDIVLPYVTRMDPVSGARLDRLAQEARIRPGWHIYTGGSIAAVYAAKPRIPDDGAARR